MDSPPLVLVVDDMADGRDLVVETLESAGFRVASAADGRAALDQAFSLDPAAIVLDLSLPELDGWEVARQLKQDERTSHVPILALSAFALPIHRDRALSAGAASFLAKPCTPSQLLAHVRILLNQSHSPTGTTPSSGELAKVNA
jgi:CheY-like chemotaxis protein